MKKIIVFFICILLCGCTSGADLNSELDAVFATDAEEQTIRRNNYSLYVDYYLPSDTGELEGTALSSRFVYNASSFVMDINISGIINDHYYPYRGIEDEGFFDDSRMVYEHRGLYVDNEGKHHEYIYKVYAYEDDYLSYFNSKDLIFYGYGTRGDIVAISSRILLMAKGAIVRENDVVAAFSSKNEIDYEKKQVNLFETIMPVNGNVNDFMVDRDEAPTSQ